MFVMIKKRKMGKKVNEVFLMILCSFLLWSSMFAQSQIQISSRIFFQGIRQPSSFLLYIHFYNEAGESFYTLTQKITNDKNGKIEINMPSSISLPSQFYLGIETDRTLPVFSRMLTPAPQLILKNDDFFLESVEEDGIILIPGDVAKQKGFPEINALDYFYVVKRVGQTCQCPEDLNWDGVVDRTDLEIVAQGNDELKRSLIPKP